MKPGECMCALKQIQSSYGFPDPVQAELGPPQQLPIPSAHFCPLHTTHYPRVQVPYGQETPGSVQGLLHRCLLNIPRKAQLLTDTASRCPVKVYRCWQLSASQMRMSFLRSPEACRDENHGYRHVPHTQIPTCPQGQPSLTRYLPSEEMAMQSIWLQWPGGCPSVSSLTRGITCSFCPLSTLPVTRRGQRILGWGTGQTGNPFKGQHGKRELKSKYLVQLL